MQTEPFHSAYDRYYVLIGGILILCYLVWCIRTGIFRMWTAPDVHRVKNPMHYWFSMTLWLLFGLGLMAAAIFNVQHTHYRFHGSAAVQKENSAEFKKND